MSQGKLCLKLTKKGAACKLYDAHIGRCDHRQAAWFCGACGTERTGEVILSTCGHCKEGEEDNGGDKP